MAASINLKVTSDFAQASADLKKFNKNFTDDQRKQIEKTMEQYKDTGINTFLARQKKLNIAIKATKGPLEASQAEFRALQREMERLIKKGIDPQAKELKPLISRYKELEKELKDNTKASKNTTKQFSLMDGVMLGAGAAALNLAKDGFRALVQYGGDAADAAADAQEVYGKFDVVFRDLTKQSNAAANALAEDFDLAGSTARKLLGDVGDVLTGFGFTQQSALDLSEQVNTLAVDLASFTNFSGGAAGASAALTKAMLGEAESVKALGIVIRQDTKEYKESVAAVMESEGVSKTQAKALVALQIALEQSKNAVGDYARTSESAANVSRRLEESQKALAEAVGTSINKAMTPMKKITAELVAEFAEWINKQREINEAIEAFESGEADAEQTITALNKKLVQQVVDLTSLSDAQRLNIAGSKEAVRIQEERIEKTRLLIGVAQRAADLQAQGNKLAGESAKANREAAEERIKLNKANMEALKELERLRFSALSADEKRLEKLQDEINRLAILKQSAKDMGTEWDAIERLLIASIAEKNEILAKTPELIDETTGAIKKQTIVFEATTARNAELLAKREEDRKNLTFVSLTAMQTELEAEELLAERRKQLWNDSLSGAVSFFSALTALSQAAAAAEIAAIDAQTQKTLESLGLLEDTKIETLQKQLDAAIEAGELETADDLRQEIERTKILDAAQVQKDKILFDAAMDQWKLQGLGILANTAQAISAAIASAPWPFNIPAIAFNTAASLAQISAHNKAKPQAPTAQTGTASPIIVPDTGRHDNVAVMAGAGEEVSVTPRGEESNGVNIKVEIDKQVIFDIANQGIESGDIRITADNIQGGIAV